MEQAELKIARSAGLTDQERPFLQRAGPHATGIRIQRHLIALYDLHDRSP